MARKHLDGNQAGQGEYLIKKTLTLTKEEYELLKRLGEGNASKGLRLLILPLSLPIPLHSQESASTPPA